MVRIRSAVRIRPAAPKSTENFGFRCFFVAKMLKTVRVKMWVNRLTHTVTHTTKCVERFKEHRRGGFAFAPVFLRLFSAYMTCAMKLPIFSAALSCICRVTWVYVLSVKPASKWPSILDTVFTSTPFCSAKVANVCLRS